MREDLHWLESVRHLPAAKLGMIIFGIALVIRLAAIFGLGRYKQPINFMEVEKIARRLAETGVFGDPYKIPTGPTAHAAPVYPFLVALIFKLAGYEVAARTAILMVSALAASLQYALLPSLTSARFFMLSEYSRLIEKPIIHYSMQLLSREYEQISQRTARLDCKQTRFTLNDQPSR